MKPIHDQHRSRMRVKYELNGIMVFVPHEVMEVLLFQCIPRINTNPIGHELIRTFGTLGGVLEAPEKELCGVKGIGNVSARFIASLRDNVLFRMLAVSDLAKGDHTLLMGAELHMRTMPAGSVTVFGREKVFDYETEDGDLTGLGEAIMEDLSAYGIDEYAVVVRCDDGILSPSAAAELGEGKFSSVFMLTDRGLCRISHEEEEITDDRTSEEERAEERMAEKMRKIEAMCTEDESYLNALFDMTDN